MEEQFYDRYSTLERSHWWFVGRRAIVSRAVEVSRRATGEKARILEVGCGTGGMLRLLRKFGDSYGIDVSQSALAGARANGAAVVRGDAYTLPFADETFSLVCAFDVLEHVEDDARALRELQRVCRRGGRLVMSVPACPSLWGRQDVVSHHFRRYRRGQVAARVREAGFDISYLSYFNTWLFPAIAAIRLARRVWKDRAEVGATDFDMTLPPAVNGMLARLLATEALAVGRFPLPIGVSLLAVASRGE